MRARAAPPASSSPASGPGATNLLTGLAQAKAAFSPVVALAGSLSSAHVYRDAFQEVDRQAVFTPVTKKSWTLTQTSRIPEMTAVAFRTALTPRQGPVLLNLPRDLLADSYDFAKLPPRARRGLRGPSGSADLIAHAAQFLRAAKAPLIIAGGGVKNGRHHASVLRLAELLNAPVATSPGHGDAVPCRVCILCTRGNVVASDLAKTADVILALGTRLGFNN